MAGGTELGTVPLRWRREFQERGYCCLSSKGVVRIYVVRPCLPTASGIGAQGRADKSATQRRTHVFHAMTLISHRWLEMMWSEEFFWHVAPC